MASSRVVWAGRGPDKAFEHDAFSTETRLHEPLSFTTVDREKGLAVSMERAGITRAHPNASRTV